MNDYFLPSSMITLALIFLLVAPQADAQHLARLPADKIAPAMLANIHTAGALVLNTSVNYSEEVNESYWSMLELSAESAIRRNQREEKSLAMQVIISESLRPEAKGRFRQCIPGLLATYAEDPDPDMRMMVIITLRAMQDREAMDQLDRLITNERNARVRRTALRVLSDFYEQQYQERIARGGGA